MIDISLLNLEEKILVNAKQLMNFSKETILADKAAEYACGRSCKFTYSADDVSEHSCVRFTRIGRRGPIYTMGYGRLCSHPNAPTILLSAEYLMVNDKKPRGRRKKTFLAEAGEFLSSIEFTAK